jgi:DNA polymerase III subunit gamma/tau
VAKEPETKPRSTKGRPRRARGAAPPAAAEPATGSDEQARESDTPPAEMAIRAAEAPPASDAGDTSPAAIPAPAVAAPMPATAPPQAAGGGLKAARTRPESYTVVARRYRPQRFEDVVGQEHVVRSLRNAIRMNRVSQAYLFCGTRGVGKTSMARIFAKCLNCAKGPSSEPCQSCDICQAIAQGQDVDVIEIDGASNNGVEQVRELRQNAGLRPSRARFKIYYIDEVHMLTTGAFNALLKILEEPPPHVKFFFATTEPGKIPITVLSRCQRYDFAGITPEAIASALGEVCVREGVEAEQDALRVLARRSGGSLRDAQSLLDRLLASGSARLTVELVHSLLGTASDERLLGLLESLASHDAAGALRLLGAAVGEGVQPAELLGGMIDYLRDAMVMAVGADSLLEAVPPRQRDRLKQIVQPWSVDTILAALQIAGECRMRMRGSLHGQLLVEMALVRVAGLENLAALGPLIEQLRGLESATAGARRQDAGRMRIAEGSAPKPLAPPDAAVNMQAAEERAFEAAAAPALGQETPGVSAMSEAGQAVETPTRPSAPPRPKAPSAQQTIAPDVDPDPAPAPAGDRPIAAATAAVSAPRDLPPLDLVAAREVWPSLIRKVGGGLGWRLSQVEPIAVEGSNLLVISAKPGYNSVADACGAPEALERIEQALQKLMHRAVDVRYESSSQDGDAASEVQSSDAQRAEALLSDPLVQKVVELFEARAIQLELLKREAAEQEESAPEEV